MAKEDEEELEDLEDEIRVNQLRYFGNISGYNGVSRLAGYKFSLKFLDDYPPDNVLLHLLLILQVFVCGANPYWIFLTSRGELRTHPMYIDGPVMCFAAFHNINCPQGFLYFNKKVS